MELHVELSADEELFCPISGTKNWTEVRQNFILVTLQEMGSTTADSCHEDLSSSGAQEYLIKLPTDSRRRPVV